jgi:hypothetical protein
MHASDLVDRMEIQAFWELDRPLTIVDKESHPDSVVRKQFRSSFNKYLDERPDRFPLVASSCPFCSSDLVVAEHAFIYDDGFETDYYLPGKVTIIDDSFDFRALDVCDNLDIPEFRAALEYCRRCRYWRYHYFKRNTFPRGSGFTLSYSSIAAKKREYESEMPDGVAGDIASWIRRTPRSWHTMNPRRFERLVADVFRRNHSAAEVHHIGRPDDGGVDVLLVESDGKRWLIQAKRREAPTASEGISTIRNLLGATVLEGTEYGMVVSTADHFSYRARQAIGRAHERGMVLRLLDRRTFDLMLDEVLPDRPWRSPVMERFPIFGRLLSNIVHSDRQMQLFH